MKIKSKKSIMGPIISVFVLILIISILSGLTFLFVAQLKTQVQNTGTGGATPANTAYMAVNSTEAAGYTVVGYLPLIFLAVIFGALLTLVLKIILPYINLGQSVGGF
jgi:ABC-type multidrug transport system permease subunit